MASHGYKKYMKKEAQQDNSLVKIFILSFFGMLLIFTFLIKSFSPTVDTSIGDYKEQSYGDEEVDEQQKKIVDDRLKMIQNEDQGQSFTDIMSRAEDVQKDISAEQKTDKVELKTPVDSKETVQNVVVSDPVYKVFIGSYSSAEQAKVAKDIIQESGSGFNPIVKCIGANNYTLQVGIFKNKQSAESMLLMVQQNHLPGRIVQEY